MFIGSYLATAFSHGSVILASSHNAIVLAQERMLSDHKMSKYKLCKHWEIQLEGTGVRN
jgi:hypothetical protein